MLRVQQPADGGCRSPVHERWELYTEWELVLFYGVTKLDGGTKDEQADRGLEYEDFCGFRCKGWKHQAKRRA